MMGIRAVNNFTPGETTLFSKDNNVDDAIVLPSIQTHVKAKFPLCSESVKLALKSSAIGLGITLGLPVTVILYSPFLLATYSKWIYDGFVQLESEMKKNKDLNQLSFIPQRASLIPKSVVLSIGFIAKIAAFIPAALIKVGIDKKNIEMLNIVDLFTNPSVFHYEEILERVNTTLILSKVTDNQIIFDQEAERMARNLIGNTPTHFLRTKNKIVLGVLKSMIEDATCPAEKKASLEKIRDQYHNIINYTREAVFLNNIDDIIQTRKPAKVLFKYLIENKLIEQNYIDYCADKLKYNKKEWEKFNIIIGVHYLKQKLETREFNMMSEGRELLENYTRHQLESKNMAPYLSSLELRLNDNINNNPNPKMYWYLCRALCYKESNRIEEAFKDYHAGREIAKKLGNEEKIKWFNQLLAHLCSIGIFQKSDVDGILQREYNKAEDLIDKLTQYLKRYPVKSVELYIFSQLTEDQAKLLKNKIAELGIPISA